MAQLNLALPDRLKGWVDSRVAEGRYASASDYVRDLIRRDESEALELAELQARIDRAVISGIDPREPADIIESIIAKNRAA